MIQSAEWTIDLRGCSRAIRARRGSLIGLSTVNRMTKWRKINLLEYPITIAGNQKRMSFVGSAPVGPARQTLSAVILVSCIGVGKLYTPRQSPDWHWCLSESDRRWHRNCMHFLPIARRPPIFSDSDGCASLRRAPRTDCRDP